MWENFLKKYIHKFLYILLLEKIFIKTTFILSQKVDMMEMYKLLLLKDHWLTSNVIKY